MKKIRITKKLVCEVVQETAGEDVVELALLLKNQDNFSEFKLAEELEQEVNLVRNKLYRLLNHNFVSFSRKKDKRKGWYIYYWTFKTNEVRHNYRKLKIKKLKMLQKRLEREENTQFFVCEHRCMRVNFDSATRFNFRCGECGELFNIEDNSKKIEEIKLEMKKIEKLLNSFV